MQRGLSKVVITLILILVSIIVIGLAWIVVSNIIQTGREGNLSPVSLSAKIMNVTIDNNSNNISLIIKINAGQGELSGINFVFSSSNTSTEVITRNVSLKELEQMSFNFHLNKSVSNLTSISIFPVIKQNEKEILGTILDKYNLGNNETNISSQTCTPATCTSLGYTCGTWNNGTCSGTLNCGLCSGGQTGSTNGIPPSSCTPASNPCGTSVCGNVLNGNCGQISCGSCSSGYTCNSTGSCAAIAVREIYMGDIDNYTKSQIVTALDNVHSPNIVVMNGGIFNENQLTYTASPSVINGTVFQSIQPGIYALIKIDGTGTGEKKLAGANSSQITTFASQVVNVVKQGGWSGIYIDIEDANKGLPSGSSWLLTLDNSLRTAFNNAGMPNALIIVFGQPIVASGATSNSWTWDASYAKNVAASASYIEIGLYDTGITTSAKGSTSAAITNYKEYIVSQVNIAKNNSINNVIFGMPAYPNNLEGQGDNSMYHDINVENLAVASQAGVLQTSNTDVFIYSVPNEVGVTSGLIEGNLPGSTLTNYTNFLNSV